MRKETSLSKNYNKKNIKLSKTKGGAKQSISPTFKGEKARPLPILTVMTRRQCY